MNGLQLNGGASPNLAAVGDSTDIDVTLTPKGAGQVASVADLNAAGGYRQTVDGFYQDNPPASQAATEMTRWAAGTAFPTRWIAPRAGSVTAVCVKSNAARTAGTLTVEVRKNGTGIGLTAVLDGTNTTFKASTQAKDTDTFVAGDELSLYLATDASWAPTTADLRASFEVET